MNCFLCKYKVLELHWKPSKSLFFSLDVGNEGFHCFFRGFANGFLQCKTDSDDLNSGANAHRLPAKAKYNIAF